MANILRIGILIAVLSLISILFIKYCIYRSGLVILVCVSAFFTGTLLYVYVQICKMHGLYVYVQFCIVCVENFFRGGVVVCVLVEKFLRRVLYVYVY